MRLRAVLLAAQVALSLIVLISATLLVRSLRKVRAIDLGFRAEQVLTAKIDLGRQNYREEQAQLFYRNLVERLRALPGAEAASLALNVPIAEGRWGTKITPEGHEQDAQGLSVGFNVVTSDYLKTMGIPLVLGRDLSDDEAPHAPAVAIVNETLAHRAWPNENPLGKVFRFSWGGREPRVVHVVGVARDIKSRSFFDPPEPFLYMPLAQFYRPEVALHVRSSGNPEHLAAAVQQQVEELDGDVPVSDIRTLSTALEGSIAPQRVAAMLVSGFGLMALLLAVVGVYGVVSYNVTQRTREIGVRVALGAQPADILKMVVYRGMFLVMAGIAVGAVSSLWLTRVVSDLLFGISATDSGTFIAVCLLLIAAGFAASYIPARRAIKMDPIVSLRCE